MKTPVGVSITTEGIQLVENVTTVRRGHVRETYTAPLLDKPLTKKQALELGLLLIKAAQS